MSHNKKRLNIIVDIDGVIADNSIQNWMEKIRNKYPRFCEKTGSAPIPFMYSVETFTGLNRKEAISLFIESTIENEPVILPECKESLDILHSRHNLYIVTSRDPKLEPSTMKWIHKNGIKYKKLIFAQRGKAEIADSIMADVAIDDNIMEYIDSTEFPKQVVIYDRPWNFSYNLANNFVRIFNWYNIMEIIGETEELECLM